MPRKRIGIGWQNGTIQCSSYWQNHRAAICLRIMMIPFQFMLLCGTERDSVAVCIPKKLCARTKHHVIRVQSRMTNILANCWAVVYERYDDCNKKKRKNCSRFTRIGYLWQILEIFEPLKANIAITSLITFYYSLLKE